MPRGAFDRFAGESTIHGLSYLKHTSGALRIFWIIVIVSGVAGATIGTYVVLQSFLKSPVLTTYAVGTDLGQFPLVGCIAIFEISTLN